MVFFVLATKLTTAANAIFLQSTAPLYLLLLGPLLLDEPIRPRDFGFIAAFAAGLSLFFVDANQATAIATNPKLGNLLALASGVCWALTLVVFRWIEQKNKGAGKETSPQSALVAGNIVAFVVCLPMALPRARAPRDGSGRDRLSRDLPDRRGVPLLPARHPRGARRSRLRSTSCSSRS